MFLLRKELISGISFKELLHEYIPFVGKVTFFRLKKSDYNSGINFKK